MAALRINPAGASRRLGRSPKSSEPGGRPSANGQVANQRGYTPGSTSLQRALRTHQSPFRVQISESHPPVRTSNGRDKTAGMAISAFQGGRMGDTLPADQAMEPRTTLSAPNP